MDARAPLVAAEGTSAGHFINQDPSMYMLFSPNHSISDEALTARGNLPDNNRFIGRPGSTRASPTLYSPSYCCFAWAPPHLHIGES